MKNTQFIPKGGNAFKTSKKPKTIKTNKLVDAEINYRSKEPDIERDSEDEMNYLAKEFGKAKNAEYLHFKQVTDGRYYFSVYFADNEQMQDFINKTKIEDLFDETGMFIAGKDFAEKLGIEIIKKVLKRQGMFKQGKKFDIRNF